MGCFQHSAYVEMTMHFRCNLRCNHCMIEDTMDRLQPESPERFDELLQHNRETGQWSGLILTGSEITLRKDLPQLAQSARQANFQHVRIQTHGMRLADMDYCRELVAAGIDEYFVSVCAGDAETHDRITKVPGSFARTLAGLENLDQIPGVKILTNTVITQQSYPHLTSIVHRLAHLRQLVQMDFWNYWPMSETDEKDLIVSHVELLPYLREALTEAQRLGRAVELKNYPECLLGNLRPVLLNDQPQLYIDPSFWDEFARNGFYQCIYRDECQSLQCLGLNTAYIQKFGWHTEELHPIQIQPSMTVTANNH